MDHIMPQIRLIAILLVISTASAFAQRPRVVPPPSDLQPSAVEMPTATPRPLEKEVPTADDAPPADAEFLIAALKAQNEALAKRTTHRKVSDGWRAEKIPTGARGMNLFSSFDHETETYARNPDVWAQDLLDHFTGVVIYNNHAKESYGGVLITPRHLLFCAHAHPHAEGTWPPNPARAGAEHRFVTADGRLVKSTQLHQAKSFHNFEVEGLAKLDFCVALLDRDLDAEGLHVAPVFPATSTAGVGAAMSWAREEDEPFAFIGVSQGVGRRTRSQPPEPIGDYPRDHAKMIYIKDRLDMNNTRPEPGPFAAWNYRVWDGDSGTPAFMLFHGEPHLWMILTTAPGNGPVVGTNVDHINALIELADRKAVAAGRLVEPTGHRLRVAEW